MTDLETILRVQKSDKLNEIACGLTVALLVWLPVIVWAIRTRR